MSCLDPASPRQARPRSPGVGRAASPGPVPREGHPARRGAAATPVARRARWPGASPRAPGPPRRLPGAARRRAPRPQAGHRHHQGLP
eukprot:15456079-Alexandrium_andersonii.AAC.1